jgi:hypothetical protein
MSEPKTVFNNHRLEYTRNKQSTEEAPKPTNPHINLNELFIMNCFLYRTSTKKMFFAYIENDVDNILVQETNQ